MQTVTRSDLAFSALLAVLVGAGVGFVGGALAGSWLAGLASGAVAAALVLRKAATRALRRVRAVRAPFPPEWRAWLERQVPFYAALDPEGRRRFEADVQIILAEQRFEGVGAQTVTWQHKLAIAAGAALMLHGRPDWDLPGGRTVLLYPQAFNDRYELEGEQAPFDDTADFDGMVHPQGPVLFSAPSVIHAWASAHDGSNVILHEWAHVFDFATGTADGVPSFMDASSVEPWLEIVRRERRQAAVGKSALSHYASTNNAELFAVSVERFFERPDLLAARHPELFGALAAFFQLDPRTEPGVPGPEGERRSLMARRWDGA